MSGSSGVVPGRCSGVAGESLFEAAVALVLCARDALEPAPGVLGVELLAQGEGELVDVAPVLVAIEERLEDGQILGGEHVNGGALAERHRTPALEAALVEGVVGKEEVD